MSKNKLSFNIVEGDTFPYEEFKKDYMDLEVSKERLLEKYELSIGRYNTQVKRVFEETGFRRPRIQHGRTSDEVHITEIKNGYFKITKNMHGVSVYFGTYPNRETAYYVRDRLVEENWSDEAFHKYNKVYGNCGPKSGVEFSPIKRDALKKYDKFKKLYYDPNFSVSDICKKLGFSKYQYKICRKKLNDDEYDGDLRYRDYYTASENPKRKYLPRKPMKIKPLSYIKKQRNGKFTVNKSGKSFGTYVDLVDAQSRRDELVASNWKT